MGWQTDLTKLKEDSTDRAHLRLGRDLFIELDKRIRKLIRRVNKNLSDPHRINEAETDIDERQRAREALSRSNFESELNRIFNLYRKTWPDLRVQYYKESMNKLARAYNRNTPSWAQMDVAFLKSELSSVTTLAQGKEMNRRLRSMESRAVDRMDDIIVNSYKTIPGKSADFKDRFRRELRGFGNNLSARFRGLLREHYTRIFEQTKERYFGVING